MSSTTLIGGRPTRFQYGDLVTGTVTIGDAPSGTVVLGRIVRATNNDPRQLDKGNVEVRTSLGQRHWVRDSSLVEANAAAHHEPAYDVVTKVHVTCGCGTLDRYLDSRSEAETTYRDHVKRVHRVARSNQR